tara:strand:- start:16617 stop:20273 length:3657 start_codon:yes stop_codon:yes gene_type:complete
MKQALKKKYFIWLIISMISIFLSWVLYSFLYATNEEEELIHFQEEVSELFSEQQETMEYILPEIEESNTSELWENNLLLKSDFGINIFRNDSLVYWNNNSIPLNASALSDYRDTLLSKSLSNGFYFLEITTIHDLKVVVSTKLKNDFFYENQDLANDLTGHFHHAHDISFSTEHKEGYEPVKLGDGKRLIFYIKVSSQRMISEWQQLVIYLLYLIGAVSLLMSVAYLFLVYAERSIWVKVLFPIMILVLRYLSVEYNWIKLFSEFQLFNPNLFATSKLFPSFGSLLLSIACLFLVAWWLIYHFKKLNSTTWLVVFYLALLPFSYFISALFESLVLNSSISLVIDEVFSLSYYSVLALMIIAGLFLSYFLLANRLIKNLLNSKLKLTTITLIWFVSAVGYFFLEIFFFQKNIYNALWPILLNVLLLYIHSKRLNLRQLKYQVFILVVVSFYGAFILFENNQFNEHQKRDLYANQLITDQDPSMEIEYLTNVAGNFQGDEFLSLIRSAKELSHQEIAMAIENRCFDTYWERYEMQYFLFDQNGSSYVKSLRSQSKSKAELERIIHSHSQASSIADGLYYVTDYFDRLSYIAREKVELNDSTHIHFYITFQSKKIPEQIGFPRLLMNEKSYALEDLEEYSIARYSSGELIMNFGDYNYSTELASFADQIDINAGFKTINDVSHYVYRQGDDQVVVISKPEKRWVEKLTTFSYLFLFFGVFVVITTILGRIAAANINYSISLSSKIQLVLISIVAVSFLIFAIVAGTNVERQYNTYTYDNLKEKVQSVKTEVSHKLEDKDSLDPIILGDYMNYILKKFSDVFVTDINLYAKDGELLATSQPKLYETGISATQMNPLAFSQMELKKRSEYIHKEKMGKLSYLSAYSPFTNKDGRLLGYLNLQHFAKQNDFENQLNEFIVAIINIAVLLLVVTVVIAIFVAGWITTPLRLIQQSFRKVELGKSNQPIDYKGDDEIGALVKDYNAKLQELELKAMQLARSERETAWREMAKQVAHEIKNPLTPMKLSLQHFQRSFSADDPNAQMKIKKIGDSLVEQIDALTKIANEFSNFAKMPKANEERMDLMPVLRNAIDLYSSKDVEINLSSELEESVVFADKDLLIRVFNNLIKNAIQATPEDQKTLIQIELTTEKEMYLLKFKDNGKGIPKELHKKIFVPNFTTKSTGAGLGLAMVKQIVHNHNGEIWFESEEGNGTTFYLSLPIHQEEQ